MDTFSDLLEPYKSVIGQTASVAAYFHQLSGAVICHPKSQFEIQIEIPNIKMIQLGIVGSYLDKSLEIEIYFHLI